RIEFGTRLGRPYRKTLALEIRQRLDAALGGGDDLDVIRIDRADGAQLVQLGLEAGLLVAFPRGFEGIAEGKGDLATALLQQDQILDRGLGSLHLGLHVRNLVAVDFSDRDAERIIDAGCATGQDVDELLGLRAGACKARRCRHGGCDQLRLHENSSPVAFSAGSWTGRGLRSTHPNGARATKYALLGPCMPHGGALAKRRAAALDAAAAVRVPIVARVTDTAHAAHVAAIFGLATNTKLWTGRQTTTGINASRL